ncbi:MAG TPA: SLOG family protein [Plantibacter sp.]|uniref:DUF2493 domain-containing protein n=1 Tax=Plantibacter sp. TaxID=1871045 RepID=UPI002C549D56|nr:SLOG family protein [Plantibacter sp.]
MSTALPDALAPAPEYRVIVTGSRDFNDRDAIRRALEALTTHANVTIVHGGARGADHIAAEEADYIGYTVEEHPADWARHGKRAGILRNLEMLDAGATRVIAFWDGQSRGTAHTIRAARERGMRVSIVRPGGEL